MEESKAKAIKEFYNAETEVSVSPHHIRKLMTKGNDSFVLVDVRSEEEYLEEHIIGALNVPAYKDRETSAYEDVDRIVTAFKTLTESNPGKEIILYCYSSACMTSKKVGKILADHDIFVKHLAIGWNEWRHAWVMWNHEHEWDTIKVEDYIVSGKEPGKLNL